MIIDAKKKEQTKRGTTFFPIQYYFSNTESPLYTLPVHWHSEFEMIHILEGTLNLFLNGREINLKKGEFCVIQDGVLHGDGSHKVPCRFESVVFDFNLLRSKTYAHDSFLDEIASHKVLLDSVVPLNNAESILQVENMFLEMRKKNAGYELFVVSRLLFIFAYVKGNGFYTENKNAFERSSLRSSQLKAVFNFINEKYASQISLDDIAKEAGMSPKYFCRVFREMTNRTPVEYLNACRIDNACTRLRETDENIADIAENCGFNDFSYFIKTFKRYKGITPNKYRNFDFRALRDEQFPAEIIENEYSYNKP